MKPIQFDGMNMVYTAPPDWDEAKYGPCGDLYAKHDEAEQTVTTCWELNEKEMDEIYFSGGKIYLTVWGGQPPVMLVVE